MSPSKHNKLFHSSDLVYIDWNIIISLAVGKNPTFLTALTNARDRGQILVVFSAAHIQEADVIADNPASPVGLSESRLGFLSELTMNSYIYNAADAYSPSLRVWKRSGSRSSPQSTVVRISAFWNVS
jgi:hypothetical protein